MNRRFTVRKESDCCWVVFDRLTKRTHSRACERHDGPAKQTCTNEARALNRRLTFALVSVNEFNLKTEPRAQLRLVG